MVLLCSWGSLEGKKLRPNFCVSFDRELKLLKSIKEQEIQLKEFSKFRPTVCYSLESQGNFQNIYALKDDLQKLSMFRNLVHWFRYDFNRYWIDYRVRGIPIFIEKCYFKFWSPPKELSSVIFFLWTLQEKSPNRAEEKDHIMTIATKSFRKLHNPDPNFWARQI